MKDVLLQLAHLEGSPVYGMLLKAESYESAYLQGMLTVYELDAMIFLRPCAELWSMEEERESASLLAGHVRDFCLMVDGMYQVDRSMWLILGTMLYKNPFSIFEDYLVSVLREPDEIPQERVLEVWDYLHLEKHGLTPRLTDPVMYKNAVSYIKSRGRARHVVRVWLMEDMERFYGESHQPFFAAGEALSFCSKPDVAFRPGTEPEEPFHRGQHVKLRLTDDRQMDFCPEVKILSDRRSGMGREARGWAWYRNCRWLLRICYDPERPERSRVACYTIYPFEFCGFHVLTFIVMDGNYRAKAPMRVGQKVRLRLMDLWGRDVILRGDAENVYENSFTLRAAFPDGRERRVTVYLWGEKESACRRDIAAVERWEQYPLPKWATKEIME